MGVDALHSVCGVCLGGVCLGPHGAGSGIGEGFAEGVHARIPREGHRGGTLRGRCPSSFGPSFRGRFCMAQHVRRGRSGERQALGSEPRTADHDLGVSAADLGLRHLGRVGCGGEPLPAEPHQRPRLRGHAHVTSVVARGQCAGRQRGADVLVPKRRHRQRCRCRRGQLDCGVSGECGRGRSMAMGVVDGRHRRRHGVPCCGHSHRRRGVLLQRISVPHSELRRA